VRRGGSKFFVKTLTFFSLGAGAAVLTHVFGYLVRLTHGLILNHSVFIAMMVFATVCGIYLTNERRYIEMVARSYGAEEPR
jgi:hypothetical protein